ncbi:hypothetical protein [Mycolicibacterium celeriflavum]|uniref:Uncharacterized protein n=1 Tax=Mycolicibacterium celeriflavum TaxID=1249101 RepID=A0A1X0BTR2_MYCCF|nr:hypothetical protein [Mycolicibacterium celeriflavum]MCV7239244.1 hypothetical protein [Mycolicibacterium celeriflavum]ORA46955.1 hypothetical protein BST21_14010 [Mycolicibacterium celeriflavum]BBY44546.1 hypothetical protein MCEL_28410 [Mycolicibacterium celeriflavum]
MSRRSDAKKARRRKRQVARNERWVPDGVMHALTDQTATAAVLEAFDARITERGWVFDDELSDEESALWFYPPSHADVPDEDLVNVTTIVLTADDVADVVHVVFVGTADDYQFDFEELFDSVEVIEAYRLGDPPPRFDN